MKRGLILGLIALWVVCAVAQALPHWHADGDQPRKHLCFLCRTKAAFPLVAAAVSAVTLTVLATAHLPALVPIRPPLLWARPTSRAPPLSA